MCRVSDHAPAVGNTVRVSAVARLVIELSSRRAVGYGLTFVAVWIVLALLRPTVTYHLAPLIVAASVPWVFVAEHRESATVRDRMAATALGGVLSVGATALLAAIARLEGPSLLPSGGAAAESLVMSIAGVAIGLGALRWRRPPA
jgi:hypothetical protein